MLKLQKPENLAKETKKKFFLQHKKTKTKEEHVGLAILACLKASLSGTLTLNNLTAPRNVWHESIPEEHVGDHSVLDL